MERATIAGMLQALEHTLEAVDRVSTVAGQLVNAQKTGKPLAPATLAYYDQQLAELEKQRARMRELIAQWWTLVEEPH